jgi:hypothetical protein
MRNKYFNRLPLRNPVKQMLVAQRNLLSLGCVVIVIDLDTREMPALKGVCTWTLNYFI